MKQQFLVASEDAGLRLDRYLAARVPELSRTRIQELIEAGLVRVNGAPAKGALRLRGAERVEIEPQPRPAPHAAPESIPLEILYEDDDLLVVNKPAGMIVHAGAGHPSGTLVNALLGRGQALSKGGGILRPGIVHRLDKDTSGLLVAAKTEAAHTDLARQFAAHTIERRYDALVWGVPKPATGTIVGDIGRSPHNRQKMAIVKRGGRHAETGYVTVAAFGSIAAHIQCRLKTGRTHQIRVHMAAIGHPVIGDPVYGGKSPPGIKIDPALAIAAKHLGRQALHAYLIGFDHPRTGKRLEFQSKITNDINALITLLEKS